MNKRMNLDLHPIIKGFWLYLKKYNLEIYNEYSFQHELGIYLRGIRELKKYRIEFERNVTYFGIEGTCKKEIDIVIYNKATDEKYAIELKYPINGQYPEQMYKFIEDIQFMEELKQKGFNNCYAFVLVDDNCNGKLFHEGRIKTGIYSYFRVGNNLHGKINNPTGENKKGQLHNIKGSYKIEWKTPYTRLVCKEYRYYLLKAQ